VLSYTVLHEETAEGVMHAASAVMCVLGPRLILNLRNAYYIPFDEELRRAEPTYNPCGS
jgi:hypothetical protein